MENQAENATKQMKHLQTSLADCQNEIKIYIQQLEEARKEHEDELTSAHNEV
jgi:gas vesicle protein